jgi:hypothetical protein
MKVKKQSSSPGQTFFLSRKGKRSGSQVEERQDMEATKK